MITIGNLTKFVSGSSCLGKKAFASYAEAEAEIGHLIRKAAHRPQQGVIAPYHCGDCLSWHLGHQRDDSR